MYVYKCSSRKSVVFGTTFFGFLGCIQRTRSVKVSLLVTWDLLLGATAFPGDHRWLFPLYIAMHRRSCTSSRPFRGSLPLVTRGRSSNGLGRKRPIGSLLLLVVTSLWTLWNTRKSWRQTQHLEDAHIFSIILRCQFHTIWVLEFHLEAGEASPAPRCREGSEGSA